MGIQDAINRRIDDPRVRLDNLLIISGIFVGYLFIYTYQDTLGVAVNFISIEGLLKIPLVSIIVFPLVRYLIVRPDRLQRSPSNNKTVRFFQREFPSTYIAERCIECVENETSCQNFIELESCDHIRYWFHHIFHGPIEKENPKTVSDTFEKGYTCKLIFYLTQILTWISALCVLVTLSRLAYSKWIDNAISVTITWHQVLFFMGCILIIFIAKISNRANAVRPSGCWHAWREVNRVHVSWMRKHDNFLVELICHDQGGIKSHRRKS